MFEFIDFLIVRPIVNLLFVVYNFVGDFGLAIIIFTIIVKFAMWPLIKKQLHQTRLMRKIQPELAEIKKNCKGNRQLEQLQMLDLYKRNNVKPMSSILTLIIQLPIFIALFTSINVMVRPTDRSVVDTAYQPIAQLSRINDLIEKQTEYFEERESDENAEYKFHPKLFGVIKLDTVAGFNSIDSVFILLFAVAASLTQYIMARQQMPKKEGKKKTFKQVIKEAAEGKEADQSELNSLVSGQMSKFMPFMMFFIMFRLPGALVFYYLLTNLVTVIQQKIVFDKSFFEMDNVADKKLIKEIKEAEIVIKDQAKTIDKNKNKKENITRITAGAKKKRRK